MSDTEEPEEVKTILHHVGKHREVLIRKTDKTVSRWDQLVEAEQSCLEKSAPRMAVVRVCKDLIADVIFRATKESDHLVCIKAYKSTMIYTNTYRRVIKSLCCQAERSFHVYQSKPAGEGLPPARNQVHGHYGVALHHRSSV